MIERLRSATPDARVLVLAFNVDAVAQLRQRLGAAVEVYTLHSYGMRLLQAAATANVDPTVVVDSDKVLHKWQALCHNRTVTGIVAVAEWRRVNAHVNSVRHSGTVPDFAVRPLTLEDAVLEATVTDHQTIDQNDQIYQCLVQRLAVDTAYNLVLVDEAQDLNGANLRFLEHVVAPATTHTVVCAVGDPTQAIYAFRGARPDALEEFGSAFRATSLYLTYCFRCPRRVVFLASHLHANIRHQQDAPLGSVDVVVSAHPWQTLVHRAQALRATEHPDTLFLARNNQTLLAVLSHLYHTPDGVSDVHWLSPGSARELRTILDPSSGALDATVGDLQTAAAAAVEQHSVSATDRLIVKVLDMAVQFEGRDADPVTSPWLQWLLKVLDDRGRSGLTVATVHAVKGEEWANVIIYDFNLFGHAYDDKCLNQDRNLLYIAITRTQRSLIFLQSKRTSHIPSPLLPVVHYAREMWCGS